MLVTAFKICSLNETFVSCRLRENFRRNTSAYLSVDDTVARSGWDYVFHQIIEIPRWIRFHRSPNYCEIAEQRRLSMRLLKFYDVCCNNYSIWLITLAAQAYAFIKLDSLFLLYRLLHKSFFMNHKKRVGKKKLTFISISKNQELYMTLV